MNGLAIRLASGAIVMALGSGLAAQAPQAPAAAPPAPQAATPEPPPVESPYTYDPAGRRDPFVSLVGRGSQQKGGSRIAGLPGMLIQEVSLKGIMRQSESFVALVQGPDKKTYVVRPGQRLFDGTVKSITADAIVFSQDVNDPLSVVKQREVRKTLRTSEEGQG